MRNKKIDRETCNENAYESNKWQQTWDSTLHPPWNLGYVAAEFSPNAGKLALNTFF
jgi:hypothetical protein